MEKVERKTLANFSAFGYNSVRIFKEEKWMKTLTEIKSDLSDIEIRPRALFAFSTRNKRTGVESGEKSVALSFSLTLWHLIWIALGAFFALQTLAVFRAALRESRIRREVRREVKKSRGEAKEA